MTNDTEVLFGKALELAELFFFFCKFIYFNWKLIIEHGKIRFKMLNYRVFVFLRILCLWG